MKLKQSSTIEDEDEDINITLNGGGILSPMPHGNQKTRSLPMVMFCHNTNSDITSNMHHPHHFHNDLRSNLQCELGVV